MVIVCLAICSIPILRYWDAYAVDAYAVDTYAADTNAVETYVVDTYAVDTYAIYTCLQHQLRLFQFTLST